MLGKFCAVIVVVGMASAGSALADWEYARWGMTESEVIAASRGLAKPNPTVYDDSTDDGSSRGLLFAPYTAGKFSFRAVFKFDRSDRLRRVNLRLEGGQCDALQAELVGRYGGSARPGFMMRWRDTASRNYVAFIQLADDYCAVEYWELD